VTKKSATLRKCALVVNLLKFVRGIASCGFEFSPPPGVALSLTVTRQALFS
jgi:hypothetical protein